MIKIKNVEIHYIFRPLLISMAIIYVHKIFLKILKKVFHCSVDINHPNFSIIAKQEDN